MNTFTLFLIACCLGIVGCGMFLAFLLRDDPRKALNSLIVTVGLALLVYGHVQWAVSREAPATKTPLYFMYFVPGWALLGIGCLGLQGGGNGKDES